MSTNAQRKIVATIVIVSLVLVAGCGTQQQPTGEELPPPNVSVDPGLAPAVEALPGFEDGDPRPLAAATDVDGETADFVANELWLSTDDEEELEAFLDRWDGEVLATFDPADYELEDAGLEVQYLVRVDASSADIDQLGEHVRELDEDATGDYSVSSDEGLQLLAAAAAEAAAGSGVGVNWVGSGEQFRDRESLESSNGPGSSYDPNAFSWPSHSSGSNQDSGVAEAWRALDFAGKLSNRIGLAVLDMGFAPDADLSDYVAISNVPFTDPIDEENLLSCSGGNKCPWHGTLVASAAMAQADNGYGSAGSAGPVARPILVFTLYDFFTSMTALGEAKLLGARIANMSYSAPVPDYVSWSVAPFNSTTAGLRRSGMLMFAAAGNDGEYVNDEYCVGFGRFKVCREKKFHTPCQNSGVICVGGTDLDALTRHGSSNFGESVDTFAPYPVWMGPTPDNSGNLVQQKGGTSYSSPFAAGVAALIWAADPSMSADRVERILRETAHESPDPDVSRFVNALGGVSRALGNIAPSFEFTSPDPDFDQQLNRNVSFHVSAEDVEDGADCCTVTFRSDVDGLLGSSSEAPHTVRHTFDSTGRREITARVVDSDGAVVTGSITIDVVNTAPEVEIRSPDDGEVIFRDANTLLRGNSSDPNEPGFELACEDLVWTSSNSGDPFPQSGCELDVAFPTTGDRTLTLTGTDSQGATDSDQVDISVEIAPGSLPPEVRILEPEDGGTASFFSETVFSGTATDPGGATDLDFEWYATYEADDGSSVTVFMSSAESFSWRPADHVEGGCREGFPNLDIDLEVTNPSGVTGSDSIEVSTFTIC